MRSLSASHSPAHTHLHTHFLANPGSLWISTVPRSANLIRMWAARSSWVQETLCHPDISLGPSSQYALIWSLVWTVHCDTLNSDMTWTIIAASWLSKLQERSYKLFSCPHGERIWCMSYSGLLPAALPDNLYPIICTYMLLLHNYFKPLRKPIQVVIQSNWQFKYTFILGSYYAITCVFCVIGL